MRVRACAAALFVAGAISTTPAAAALTPLTDVVQLSVGAGQRELSLDGFGCVVTSGGGVQCWGNNARGQLGDGSFARRAHASAVSGLASGVQAVSASSSIDSAHACALMTDTITAEASEQLRRLEMQYESQKNDLKAEAKERAAVIKKAEKLKEEQRLAQLRAQLNPPEQWAVPPTRLPRCATPARSLTRPRACCRAHSGSRSPVCSRIKKQC